MELPYRLYNALESFFAVMFYHRRLVALYAYTFPVFRCFSSVFHVRRTPVHSTVWLTYIQA